MGVCEFELETGTEPDWLREGGRGGTFSVSADDKTVILEILFLREPAKEGRFRRPSSFRLGSVMVTSECLFGLGSVLVVRPPSRLVPVDWEMVAVLLVLLIELELFILAKFSFFLTGMTTPSPPSPKRENFGIGSVTDIQFSLGSREIDGGRG